MVSLSCRPDELVWPFHAFASSQKWRFERSFHFSPKRQGRLRPKNDKRARAYSHVTGETTKKATSFGCSVLRACLSQEMGGSGKWLKSFVGLKKQEKDDNVITPTHFVSLYLKRIRPCSCCGSVGQKSSQGIERNSEASGYSPRPPGEEAGGGDAEVHAGARPSTSPHTSSSRTHVHRGPSRAENARSSSKQAGPAEGGRGMHVSSKSYTKSSATR
ncbi:hypothetical protein B296_00002922 [Ensete ventricosum]|uniref:Uncharacterized protein n=1 Tax=Ensete ventricosum TaxID=4639 RepID=A0A426Z9X6_ENSVE|nr:hypothetical protein B296_00002922 [Ensete ventricosum]